MSKKKLEYIMYTIQYVHSFPFSRSIVAPGISIREPDTRRLEKAFLKILTINLQFLWFRSFAPSSLVGSLA